MLGSRLYGEAWHLIGLAAALLTLLTEVEATRGALLPSNLESADSLETRAYACAAE
jgi:hypothetical protein